MLQARQVSVLADGVIIIGQTMMTSYSSCPEPDSMETQHRAQTARHKPQCITACAVQQQQQER